MAQDITRTSLKIHPYMNLGARQAHNPRDIPEANNIEASFWPLSSMQLHGICSALGQAANSQINLLALLELSVDHTHSKLFRLHLAHCHNIF